MFAYIALQKYKQKGSRGVARKQKHQYVRKSQRYAQMVAACLQLEHEGKRPTVASVCKIIGLSVSTYARNLMNEIASDGYIYKLEDVHWNGKQSFIYMVNNENLWIACPEWYQETAKSIGIQLTLPMMNYDSADPNPSEAN